MSADTVIGGMTVVEPPTPTGHDTLARSTVDPFDLAAHLEATGFGDRWAAEAGHGDIFTLATTMWQPSPTTRGVPSRAEQRRSRAAQRARLVDAAARSTVLVAGVVLAWALLPPTVGDGAPVALAGIAAWLGSHLVAVVMWHGMATSPQAAVVAGRPAFVGGLVIAALLAAGVSPVPALWLLWGVTSAVLTIGTQIRPLALAMLVASGSLLVVMLIAPFVAWLAAHLVLGVAVACAVKRCLMAGQWRVWRLSPAALLWGLAQAGGQILVMLCAMSAVPPQRHLAVAVAGLIAAVLTDPMLEFAQLRAGRHARQAEDWHTGQRRLARLAALTVAGVITASAAVGTTLASGESTAQLAATVLGVSVMGCTCLAVASALRAGAASVATRVSAWLAGVAILLVLLPVALAGSPLPGLVIVAGAALVLAWRGVRITLSTPHLW